MNNVFENLSQRDRDFIESRLLMAKLMIWKFHAKKDGVKFKYFKCDATCLEYLEHYLFWRIRTRIMKWNLVGDSIVITRVKTKSGVASRDKAQIQEVLNLLMACSILLGQCIAKRYEGKWRIGADKDIQLEVYDIPFDPYSKCLKLVTLGTEESLISYLLTARQVKRNHLCIEDALYCHHIERADYKKIDTLLDEIGAIKQMTVIDHKDESIFTATFIHYYCDL